METCFICGKQNATIRREVYIGHSNGTGTTSSGEAIDIRTNNYELKMICKNCSINLDRERAKAKKRALAILCILLGMSLGGGAISLSVALGISIIIFSCGIGVFAIYRIYNPKRSDDRIANQDNNKVEIKDRKVIVVDVPENIKNAEQKEDEGESIKETRQRKYKNENKINTELAINTPEESIDPEQTIEMEVPICRTERYKYKVCIHCGTMNYKDAYCCKKCNNSF